MGFYNDAIEKISNTANAMRAHGCSPKMKTFRVDVGLDATDTTEDNGAMTTLH